LADPAADATARRRARNVVAGEVRLPSPSEIPLAPVPGTPEHARLSALGEAALRRGELAFCVMAGGMATRMGGVVKALVEACAGKTFLQLRLAENASWSARGERPLPLWLMVSDATEEPTKAALASAGAPAHVRTFLQGMGLRLTPSGQLFRDEAGEPSSYSTGHGDLVDALRRSGFLGEFRAAGGKYVWIANLDNLGATVDPAILGHFIETGREVMVEVCEKAAGDKGGIPVHALGRLQVLEEFRLPEGVDPAQVRVFNTNTFVVSARALAETPIEWHWFEVEKKVGGAVAIQFERLLQELTAALDAAYLTVPREGVRSRFLPVKDPDELVRRRAEIEAVARTRGML
ncbi:MAG: UTP--glucose-1-phosphate uridylyltransferase, partial [Deltaproteobacteria bacterium]|nr:UTP--glucose-1-phosphate uridylyltransferase [Deltaproteobacteria bacterium]